MMIDGSEAERFEGEMPKLVQRHVGTDAPRGDVGEQRRDALGTHATRASGARYSAKIASASAMLSTWKSFWRSSVAP